MSTFDKNTGMILSSSEEALQEIQADNEDFQEADEKQNIQEPIKKSVKLPRLNKKRILLVLMSLVALIVLVTFVKPAKKKIKNGEDDQASELYAPNFEREIQKIYEKTDEKALEKPVVINSDDMVSAPSFSQERGQSQTITTIPSMNTKTTVPYSYDAEHSSLIPDVQGRILGQNPTYSSSSGESNFFDLGNLIPSAGAAAQSQSDYMGERLAALSDLYGSSGGSNSTYAEQNMQSNKQAFYNAGKNEGGQNYFISENTLWNGTIIPGVLITGINTDLPGDVQARVSENVYDSQTGKQLLIPQGSILIASYNSSVSFAQSRVQIAWNTLIRPDGYQVSLGNMNGVDSQGMAGTKGSVNEHFFQYAKAAGIITLFTILNAEFNATTASLENQTLKDVSNANQGIMNQLGNKMLDKALDVQPTLTVKNGTKINIMLNQNIRLPAVEDYPVTKRYIRN